MSKVVLLNKELMGISSDFMKAYQSDINLDIEKLLDKNLIVDEFVWVVRETGTHLYEHDRLFVLEDSARIDYLYFEDYKALAYKIKVTKRGRTKVYGEIEQLNRKKLTQDIKDKAISYSHVQLKVLLDSNKKMDLIVPCKDDTFYKILDLLKVDESALKKIYRLKYLNQ